LFDILPLPPTPLAKQASGALHDPLRMMLLPSVPFKRHAQKALQELYQTVPLP
jgi:hypothetical protein